MCFSLYIWNTKRQEISILDANRRTWINFIQHIDKTTYSLGQGFLGSYYIGMEHKLLSFPSIYSLSDLFSVPYSK
jgi:hypothetical protein